tara:strand:+ start:1117 stop:1950 length:834 start_codon:yes stop_codon:yes gene_type:complete
MIDLEQQFAYNSDSPVLAAEPSSHVSEDYKFLSTIDTVNRLNDEGWRTMSVQHVNKRDKTKLATAKHRVILAPPGDFSENIVGGTTPRLIIQNSHDGTSALRFMLGLFRMICSNGMIVSTSMLEAMRMIHKQSHRGSMDELLNRFGESWERTSSTIEKWKNITLNGVEAKDFALKAFQLRHPSIDKDSIGTNHEQLLLASRTEDESPTLWHRFNTVQERLTLGGYSIAGPVPDGALRNRRQGARALRGAAADTRMNRGLWDIALQAESASLMGHRLN